MLAKWYLLFITTLQFSEFHFVNSREDNLLEFGENYDKGTPPQGIQTQSLLKLNAYDLLSFTLYVQI